MDIYQMKKLVSGWLVVLLFVCGLALWSFSGEAMGARAEVEIDGEKVNAVVHVFIRDGRLFVPVRLLAERMNVELTWDEKTNSLSLKTPEGHEMLLQVGSNEVKWNDSTYYMDTTPVERYERVFVPARHLAEIAGFQFKWDPSEEKIMFIGSDDETTLEEKPEFLNAIDQAELQLLAKIIYAEAGYEDFEGQVAVGNVILNRVENPKFPDTIRDVIYQPGQFGPVSSGKINQVKPSDTAIDAAKQVLTGENVVEDALYFYNPRVSKQSFWGTLEVVADIGNHRFLK